MNASPSANCMGIAAKAADNTLSQSDIMDAFAELDEIKRQAEAEGRNARAAVSDAASRMAEDAKIAAALQKRQAAINILVRKRNDLHIARLVNAGMWEHDAMLAFMEGATGRFAGAMGGRKSVWSLQKGARNRYVVAGVVADIQRERPHLQALLSNEDFDDAVTREMHELREGGNPGITNNDDAKWLAKTLASWQELSRTERNRVGGAGIGKLEGRASTQIHDDIKMIRAGKERWVGFIIGHKLLDVTRTFGRAVGGDELARILGDIYDTIITGVPNKPTPAEIGQRVGPANLAKSLGKHRVLHFKDADASIMYRKEFGHGGTIAGVFSELGRAGDQLGLFESLGSNPRVMVEAMMESQKRALKTRTDISPEEKARRSALLDSTGGALKGAIDIMMGEHNRPAGDGRWATIGENIRSVQRMSGLGGVVLTSVPGDAAATAIAAQFRGSNFFKTFVQHWGNILRGRPKGERAEISYLAGEGADGMISALLGGRVAWDSPTGAIAKAQDTFFRFNGLTYTTDIARAFNGRLIAAEMGMNASKSYGELYGAYRHLLGLHGIDEVRWDVLRQASRRQMNGKPYLTADLIRDLPDAAFEPLIRDRLAAIAGKPDYAERAAAIAADARRSLELDTYALFADEVSYGVVTPDARAQRTATWGGTRSGTRAGELARYVMQYLSTPIAYVQRPLSRAIFGQRHKPNDLRYWGHIGTGLAAMMMAGYLSMVAKDTMRGYWPPRDPRDYRTILGAALQSGALGVYGDFLFSQANRFGRGLSETAVGPTIGSVLDLIQIGADARDYALSGGEDKFSTARAFSTLYGMTPGANLWFVAPAMNILWVNSVREALSPGYLKKQRTTRRREYGQEKFLPDTAF